MGRYDSYDIEYHLTADGWVEGTSDEKTVDPPVGRVLTIHKSMRQSSGWSREDIDYTEDWRDAGTSDKELSDLKRKFPQPLIPRDSNPKAILLHKARGRMSRIMKTEISPP